MIGRVYNALDNSEFIKISNKEYDELLKSIYQLRSMLRIEQRFAMLVDSYIQIEQYKFSLTLEWTLINKGSHQHFAEEIMKINSLFLNFCAHARMYFDQLPHEINSNLKDEIKFNEKIKQTIANYWDNKLAYRFFDEYRNIVQHELLIPFNMSRGFSRKGDELHKYANFIIKKRELETLKSKEKSKEHIYDQLDEDVDIYEMLREYVESIMQIHKVVRKQINPVFNYRSELFTNQLNKYKEALGDFLMIHPKSFDIYLNDNHINTIKHFFRKYGINTNITKFRTT